MCECPLLLFLLFTKNYVIIFASDCEGAVYGLRNVLDPNGPNCEKLFNLLQKYLSKMQREANSNYASFDKEFKMLYGINFTDTAAVKERACQIVGKYCRSSHDVESCLKVFGNKV